MVTLLWPGKTFTVSHLEVPPLFFNTLRFLIYIMQMIKGVRKGGMGPALSYLDTLEVPIIENTPNEEDLKDSMAEVMFSFVLPNVL